MSLSPFNMASSLNVTVSHMQELVACGERASVERFEVAVRWRRTVGRSRTVKGG
jgi:hypothetical protein